jgi:hypothetical protein
MPGKDKAYSYNIKDLSPSAKKIADLSSAIVNGPTGIQMHTNYRTVKDRSQPNKPIKSDEWYFKHIELDEDAVEPLSIVFLLETGDRSKKELLEYLKELIKFELNHDPSRLNEMRSLYQAIKNHPDSWAEIVDIFKKCSRFYEKHIVESGFIDKKLLLTIMLERSKISYQHNIQDEIDHYEKHPESRLLTYNQYSSLLISDEQSRESLSANLALTEMEVLCQEYRRLLCPTHLLDGFNPFPKTRVAFDKEKVSFYEDNPKVYVASKAIEFINIFNLLQSDGTFIFNNQVCHIGDTPGLGVSAFFSKILFDDDTKLGNFGLRYYGKKGSKEILICTNIDSGRCLVGVANLDCNNRDYSHGSFTPEEVLLNPYTQFNKFNYLWQKMQSIEQPGVGKVLRELSECPTIRAETFVTALRCAILPEFYLKDFISMYFSHENPLSQEIAKKIENHFKKQQADLQKILIELPEFQQYFLLNPFSIDDLTLVTELRLLCESLQNFEVFRKINLVKSFYDNFEEKFLESVEPFLSLFLNKLSLKDQEYFLDKVKELVEQNLEDHFNQSFLQKVEKIVALRKSVQDWNVDWNDVLEEKHNVFIPADIVEVKQTPKPDGGLSHKID